MKTLAASVAILLVFCGLSLGLVAAFQALVRVSTQEPARTKAISEVGLYQSMATEYHPKVLVCAKLDGGIVMMGLPDPRYAPGGLYSVCFTATGEMSDLQAGLDSVGAHWEVAK